MIVKQIPEDFIVKEIPGYIHNDGSNSIFKLTKKDYTTEKAIYKICEALHINRKRVGYAGIKDKRAITEQYISIEMINKEKVETLNLKDIHLDFICYSRKRLSLGDLNGNKFEIIVRDLDENCYFETSKLIKNYFDEQRFSNNNIDIGKAIIKKDLKKAIELILENEGDYEYDVRVFLEQSPNNYITALRKIPHKILLLFIHAYQSFLFNKIIEKINFHKNIEVPLIGFGTEYENKEVEKIAKTILLDEKVSERDFIISSMPDLSSEGGYRLLYVEPKHLEFTHLEKDELNKDKYKVKISFSLPRGAYATNVIKQIVL